MSLTAAQIQNFLVSFLLSPQVIDPLSEAIPGAVPLDFASIKNLKVKSGTWTPANDDLQVLAFASADLAPNFIMVIVDKPVNLRLQTAGQDVVNGVPVSKVAVITMPKFDANYVNAILFDGRTIVQNPVEQGADVNYTLVCCNADIT